MLETNERSCAPAFSTDLTPLISRSPSPSNVAPSHSANSLTRMSTLYREAACAVRYKERGIMSRKNRKKPAAPAARVPVPHARPKPAGAMSHSIAEWTFNFIILIFATSTIAQPFVIPTSSMEDNLLVGDHLIVDRMAYAPTGRFSRHLLPYEPVKRGDIIVFRYPLNIKEDYVKRVIGIP